MMNSVMVPKNIPMSRHVITFLNSVAISSNHGIAKHIFRKARAEFVKPIVPSVLFGIKTRKMPKNKETR